MFVSELYVVFSLGFLFFLSAPQDSKVVKDLLTELEKGGSDSMADFWEGVMTLKNWGHF